MNYDHNKKFGLLKFHSGYGTSNLNSPKGYSLKIINVQTGAVTLTFKVGTQILCATRRLNMVVIIVK